MVTEQDGGVVYVVPCASEVETEIKGLNDA